jgi:hypothetical protein
VRYFPHKAEMRLGDFIKAIEMATAESELRLPDMHSGPPGPFWFQVPGMAVSGLLLIFCILEVFIASISAHFGCQLTCYQTNNVSPRGSSEDGKRSQRGWRLEGSSYSPSCPGTGGLPWYLKACPVLLASSLVHFLFACVFQVGVVIPNVYVTNPAVIPEPENSPPNYSDVPRDK